MYFHARKLSHGYMHRFLSPASADYRSLAVTLMFPSGLSSTPTPPQQCTTIIIVNDSSTDDQEESFTLHASSSDSSVFFTPGGNTASILIQDDDSKFQTCKAWLYVIAKLSSGLQSSRLSRFIIQDIFSVLNLRVKWCLHEVYPLEYIATMNRYNWYLHIESSLLAERRK